MTALAREVPRYDSLGTSHDLVAVQESASVMRQRLELTIADSEVTFVAKSDNHSELYITPQLSKLLQEFLGHIEEGGDVSLLPNTKLFSISEAHKMLSMNESNLLKLVEQGVISVKTVDGRKFVEASSLYSYQRQRQRKGYALLDKMYELQKDDY